MYMCILLPACLFTLLRIHSPIHHPAGWSWVKVKPVTVFRVRGHFSLLLV